jgi:hypothetical protein
VILVVIESDKGKDFSGGKLYILNIRMSDYLIGM